MKVKKAYHRSESDGGVWLWMKRRTFYESDIYHESEGDDDILVLGEEASV